MMEPVFCILYCTEDFVKDLHIRQDALRLTTPLIATRTERLGLKLTPNGSKSAKA